MANTAMIFIDSQAYIEGKKTIYFGKIVSIHMSMPLT